MNAVLDKAAPPIIRVENLSKTFAGTQALSHVDIELRGGELHALLGANGSGKSTLIKILSGYHVPDPGARFWLDDREVKVADLTHLRQEGGSRLGFVHQDLGLIMEMNTIENLAMRSRQRGLLLGRREREYAESVRELIRPFTSDLDVTQAVSRLSSVNRTIVAIAGALQDWDRRSGVLVLDEPTATLPPAEVERLFETLRVLLSDGASVLYVSHRLEEVFAIAHRVTILRNGRRVSSESIHDTTRDSVIEAMLGIESASDHLSLVEGHHVIATTKPALQVRHLAGLDLRGVSFNVGEGEIVGVAGYPDSGRDELPRILTDRRRDANSGEVATATGDGWEKLSKWAGEGVALIPPDRLRESLITVMTVEENLTLSSMGTWKSKVFLRYKHLRSAAMEWIERLDIRGPGVDSPISELSGGNQQKVVIARALMTDPRVLVMCEPTAGVDIGARHRIYEIVRQAVQDGLAVLVMSSDMDDLLAMCGRVMVLRDGLIARELSGMNLTEANLVRAMARDEESELGYDK